MGEIEKLEAFLHAGLAALDLEDTLVVLTSDHGNVEDISFRGHTRNPALTIVWGPRAAARAAAIRSIEDVPRILRQAIGEMAPARG